MKAKLVAYWIATVLISAMMLMSAFMYLTSPMMVESFHSLGYPDYFREMLAVAKFLGVAALLVPGLRIVKEWAYAGFAITFVSAVVSHLACGQTNKVAAPVVALVLLAVSYALRPAERRVAEAPAL